MPDEIKTFETLENCEIFAVGKWNNDKYSSADLQQLVDNFNTLKDVVKPPAKIGHSEHQELLKKEGLPAAGWVDSVKMVGNKIVATFKDVPKVVKDLIDRKAYKRVSAEIYPKYKNPADGKTYNNVLRAVAFLGSDIPAVETLSDISNLYTEDNTQEVRTYTIDVNTLNNKGGGEKQIMGKWRVFVNGSSKEELSKKLSESFGEGVQVAVEDADMVAAEEQKKKDEEVKNKEIKDKKIEELTQQYEAVNKLQGDKDKQISDLQAKIAELEGKLTGKDTEMMTMKGQMAEFQKNSVDAGTKLAEFQKNAKTEAIKTFVKQSIAEGKLLPKDETIVVALMEQLDDKVVLKFKQDDKEAESPLLEVIKKFISDRPKAVNLSEISPNIEHKVYDQEAKVTIGGVNYEVRNLELVQKAEKYAQDNKVEFDVALVAVSKETETK